MLPGDPLLDTNALIAWMGFDPALNRRFAGRDIYASVVSIGELYFGACKSNLRSRNAAAIQRLLGYAELVRLDLPVAELYGDLKQQLRAAGKPIPDNDLWIAATAIEHHLVLVTRDKHFELIPGLAVETW